MNLSKKIYSTFKNFIYKYIEFLTILFSLLSFIPIISFISIAFFVWNFYNRNAFRRPSFIFLSIAILLNILYFAYVKPWSDSVQKEWNVTGYDIKYAEACQTFLNLTERQIEDYKMKKGTYPESLNNLSELENRIMFNLDLSYRIKMEDGQVNGQSFYYRKISAINFYLSAVGPDGVGETEDDIMPEIYHYQIKSTGLVKYKLLPIGKRDIKNGYSDSTIKPKSILPLLNVKSPAKTSDISIIDNH